MLGMIVGLTMSMTADISMMCNKTYYDTVKECEWYVQDCILDGEKPLWCLVDYDRSIKEGKGE